MIFRNRHLMELDLPEYYLEDMKIEDIQRKTGKKRIAKLSFNESPYGVSPKVLAAAATACEDISRYGDPYQVEFVEAIAQYTGMSKEMIAFGNGADELIDLIFRTFVGPEDEVLIPLPIFGTYLMDPKVAGAQIRTISPQEDLDINLNLILKEIGPKTKIVALCNPNNPTGKLIPSKEIHDWLKKIPAHVLVIIDEAYGEYVESEDFYPGWKELEYFPNLIILRTFSKIFGLAGIRMGYAISTPEIIKEIEVIRKIANVNNLAAAMGVAALKEESFVQEIKMKNTEERERVSNKIQELGFHVLPSHTNFVMVRFGEKADELYEYLVERGIITRMGWGLLDYIRISLGTPEENSWLLDEITAWSKISENEGQK